MATASERCPGCGSVLPAHNGPTHTYMLSSPSCWAAFGDVLAREYSNPDLMDVHRLTVDTWAVQHPGDGSRQAIQSVGMHLCRIRLQLEHGYSGLRANDAMQELSRFKAELPELPARLHYAATVANVVGAVESEAHKSAVIRWARATWEDWADQHDFVAGYLTRAGLA